MVNLLMKVDDLNAGIPLIEFEDVVKEFKAKKNGFRIKFNAVGGWLVRFHLSNETFNAVSSTYHTQHFNVKVGKLI